MAGSTERVFKTAWFAKAAKKASIADQELCVAIAQVKLGQADDLGGGVFKKRLGRNLYRGILVAKGRTFWVYTYLFAKKDRANIERDELLAFREFAAVCAEWSVVDIQRELNAEKLVEICHEQTK